MDQLSAASPAIVQATWPHTVNVAAHVIFGTVALVLGYAQLVMTKGGFSHRSRGRMFLASIWIVVATAVVGLGMFRFSAFLAVITMLSAYWAYSGRRAERMREHGPSLQDAAASAAGLVTATLFVGYLQRVRFPWAPQVIYSTLGVLVAVCLYDLARFLFPTRWFGSLWLYEHVVKMIGAHSTVVSAFAGTVLWMWQPYSQLLPSVLSWVTQIGFIYQLRRQSRSRQFASSPAGSLHFQEVL